MILFVFIMKITQDTFFILLTFVKDLSDDVFSDEYTVPNDPKEYQDYDQDIEGTGDGGRLNNYQHMKRAGKIIYI